MTMIKYFLISMLLCVNAGFCATEQETPQDAAGTIAGLLEKRDYSTLFEQRYTEWYKVEAEGVAPEAAIKKLSSRWEKQHGMLLSVFKQLASAEFTLSKSDTPNQQETGDVATATITLNGKDIPYQLFKMKNGLWGFHQ